jgi:hypothetical protein
VEKVGVGIMIFEKLLFLFNGDLLSVEVENELGVLELIGKEFEHGPVGSLVEIELQSNIETPILVIGVDLLKNFEIVSALVVIKSVAVDVRLKHFLHCRWYPTFTFIWKTTYPERASQKEGPSKVAKCQHFFIKSRQPFIANRQHIRFHPVNVIKVQFASKIGPHTL